MANIIHYYQEKGNSYILIAHCTSPLCFSKSDDTLSTELDTHFETDIGIALRVKLAKIKE